LYISDQIISERKEFVLLIVLWISVLWGLYCDLGILLGMEV
jgi:hypothetical protein